MHIYLEFFAVFQNVKIFMYSPIARGNPDHVLRADGMVDEVNMEHWWNDTDGKTEILREKGCPHAAVSTTLLTWAGRPVTVRRVVDTVAVRVLRLPLSVGRTDISGDCGVLKRLRLGLTVPKPPTKNSSHQDGGISVANIKSL